MQERVDRMYEGPDKEQLTQTIDLLNGARESGSIDYRLVRQPIVDGVATSKTKISQFEL